MFNSKDKNTNLKLSFNKDIRYYIEQKKKELYLLKKSSTPVRDVVCYFP